MSNSGPTISESWRPNAPVVDSFYVGRKCIVIRKFTEDGVFVEAGGVLPEGGGGFDPLQARFCYSYRSGNHSTSIDIELPEDFPFRASRKGKVANRTKSFLPDGNPVPEIRMLFALKTRSPAAAQAAMDTFPWEELSGKTIGEKLLALNDINGDWHHLTFLIGRRMAIAASKPHGLADWALWERVADDAAEKDRRRTDIAKGKYPPDIYGLFLTALKNSIIRRKGLPAHPHVQTEFEKLGGSGEAREIRKTLGFGWLPTERDWTSNWLRRA